MRTGREYLRVSQDRDGRMRSPAEQHAENVATANRRDVQLGDPYQENRAVGASRHSHGTRDDFDRLLEDISQYRFGANELWLWEPSRGSRRVSEWVALLEACERAQIRIWVTSHGRLYDPTNHRDRRTLLEDAVDSEYAAAEISDRVKRSVRARAAAGRPHGKHLYGYRRVYAGDGPRRVLVGVEIDEATAATVREAFRRFAEGDGLSTIALDFTRRGLPTPGKSAVWRSTTVRSMVMNEGYLGHRVSPRARHARIMNAWPALVDDLLGWRCKARIDDPDRAPRGDLAVRHLLSGLAVCGMPGCAGKHYYKATGVHGKANPSYLCGDRRHNSRKAGAWSPDPDRCTGLEGQVVEYVLELWAADDRLGQGEDPRAAEIDAALRGMRARLDAYRVAGASADGPSPAAVAVIERELGPQIEAAERQLSGLLGRAALPDLGGRTLREAWPTLTLAQRRTIIAASVTVRVLPVGRGTRYDPASIEITPRW